jgi:MinD superfamily P-loop ATPase
MFGLSTNKYEEWIPLSTNKVAAINPKKCTGCKKCIETCYFNSIKLRNNKIDNGNKTDMKIDKKTSSKPKVDAIRCEGCGACTLVCPSDAITMVSIENAFIGHAKTGHVFNIASAQLLPGNTGSGKVVSEVRKKAAEIEPNAEITIIDAAAGTSCPVIASVTGTDLAIVVTEPTPSGYYDMIKALEIVKHFNTKPCIIINKYDINLNYAKKIESFAKDKGIRIISKIKFDKTFVKAMTDMKPIVEYKENYIKVFESIVDSIEQML